MRRLNTLLFLGCVAFFSGCYGDLGSPDIIRDVSVMHDGAEMQLSSEDLEEGEHQYTSEDVTLYDEQGVELSSYKAETACYLCDECHVDGNILHCTGCNRVECR